MGRCNDKRAPPKIRRRKVNVSLLCGNTLLVPNTIVQKTSNLFEWRMEFRGLIIFFFLWDRAAATAATWVERQHVSQAPWQGSSRFSFHARGSSTSDFVCLPPASTNPLQSLPLLPPPNRSALWDQVVVARLWVARQQAQGRPTAEAGVQLLVVVEPAAGVLVLQRSVPSKYPQATETPRSVVAGVGVELSCSAAEVAVAGKEHQETLHLEMQRLQRMQDHSP
jgi:hypothetical protein